MTLPNNITTGGVIGRFLTSTGDPVSGTVTFFPSAKTLLDTSSSPNPTTIVNNPVVCTFDGTGSISTHLIATDNVSISPVGWTWNAIYNVTGTDGKRIHMPVQTFTVASNSTIDLTSITSVPASNGTIITKGDQGPQGSQGPQGLAGTNGIKGDSGIRGTTWFSSGPSHYDYGDVTGMIAGDIFLYPVSRDYFTYDGTNWNYTSNIGAITGPQGPQGVKGDTGGTYTRTSEAAGRALYLWDSINNREQLVFGDTGWRNINSSVLAGFTGSLSIRRQNGIVTVNVQVTPATAAGENAVFANIPAAFRPDNPPALQFYAQGRMSNSLKACQLTIRSSGDLSARTITSDWVTGDGGYLLQASWSVNAAWPTTLPGVSLGIPNQ